MSLYNNSLKTNLYTFGKFGKNLRETLDTESNTLYDRGKMKAKIKPEDITPDFCKIHCKSIWYMDGFLKASTVRHILYDAAHINHLFKDDALYISYERPIKQEKDGILTSYQGYDFLLSGNDIVRFLNHLEEYGTTNVKPELQKAKQAVVKKIEWYKENCPDDYFRIFQTNDLVDVFNFFK